MLYTIETVDGRSFTHNVHDKSHRIKDILDNVHLKYLEIKEDGVDYVYNINNIVRIYTMAEER